MAWGGGQESRLLLLLSHPAASSFLSPLTWRGGPELGQGTPEGEAPPTKWEGVGLGHLQKCFFPPAFQWTGREWRLPALFLDVRGRKVSVSNSIVSESLRSHGL